MVEDALEVRADDRLAVRDARAGDRIKVEGRLSVNSWKPDGSDKWRNDLECMAFKVETRRVERQQAPPPREEDAPPFADGDIPF